MANISSIKLPNGTTYTLKDNGALQLTGGTVTGPTIFENSVDIDEATVGDLVATGAVTFTNYPTTIATSSGTNQLTLISNTKYVLTTPGGSFIFTTPVDNDTKVSTAAVTSGTTYYPVVGANTTSAATKFYDSTGINYTATNGTANGTNGAAVLVLGNNIASSTANWKAGKLSLYGTTVYATTIVSGAPSAARTITLPNKDGTVALTSDLTWSTVTGKPTATGSKVTGITASTTATKTTLGTAFTIPNVTSAGSASNWVFEDVACDDITAWSAGSFTRGTFSGGSGSFTQGTFSGGSGSFTASVSNHVLSFSHTHTAATHGADSHTHTAATHAADSYTAPSLTYGAKTASHVKSGGNGSAPTLGTAFTVPNVTGNTSATVSITDPGHTHSI